MASLYQKPVDKLIGSVFKVFRQKEIADAQKKFLSLHGLKQKDWM
jgi:hypothetical protein